MAYKDCIKTLRKAGRKVELGDRRRIKQYMDEGLTDEQAVRRLAVEASKDVIDITEEVRAAGGEVRTGTGQLAEIRDFRTEQIRSYMGERSEVVDKILALQAEYTDMQQDGEIFDELLSKGVNFFTGFNQLTEGELKMHIGQLMMRATTTELNQPHRVWPEDRFRVAMERETLSVHGTTPDTIYDSRVALEERMAENRKQKQLLDAEKAVAQGKIDALMGPDTTREFKQGPTDDFQEFEGAQVQTDQGRIAQMLGPHLYGDQKNMGMVTVKELFQNSFDAVRAAIEKGQIEDGQIDITLDGEGRTITIEDNGVGMTSDMIRDGLLTIGGTGKEGSVNSGGFGIAKMLFLFGADSITVSTVRDGVRSTLEATGPSILANARDSSLPLDPNQPADRAIRREKSDAPNGTTVEIKIPENYTDQNSGETNGIRKVYSYEINELLGGQLLHPKISVTRDGTPVTAGANFDISNYDSVGKIDFQWGSADILVSKSDTSTYGENVKILNNGLIQFSESVTQNPFETLSDNVPRKFIIDLHPNGDPGSASYPFELNRQSLREHAKTDIDRLTNYFTARYREDTFASTSEGYGKLVALDKDNKPSAQIDIAPAVAAEDKTGLVQSIDPSASIEIVDGILMVNGEEQTELTQEDIENASFDVSKYKIDQSQVPTDQPLVHSQMSFKADTIVVIPEAQRDPDAPADQGGFAMDFGGTEVNEALYQIFGEDRVNNYFGDIGRVLMRMKNVLSKMGDERFEKLAEVGVGVSILGSSFYGVHTAVPARMLFINPGADPHDMDSTISKREDLTDTQRMQLIASSMLGTMIHEIAHYAEMNHENRFIFAMESVYAQLDNTPTLMKELRDAMRTTLRDNYDIYQFIEGQFRADALEVTGLSLKDVGTEQARDDVGVADDAAERDEAAAGPSAQEAGRSGDRAIGGELNDEQLQAGLREDGSVVPPGSVHPQAGEGAALMEAGTDVVEFSEQVLTAHKRLVDAQEKLDSHFSEGPEGSTVSSGVAGAQQGAVTRANAALGKAISEQFPDHTMQQNVDIRTALSNGQTGIEPSAPVPARTGQANLLKQDERGRITFNEARKGFIDILSSGDFTTFVHETGHLYLEVLKWAASEPDAPQQIIDDWATIKRITGATDETISREAHEKFANMFEIYALEGKAPSLALQDSFNAFRRWFLLIYAKLKNIGGVHLNPEVRGVLDRMLATDAEIAVAEQSQGYVALFADAETAGMTAEEFDFYSKQLQRTHDEAVEKETRRMIEAMHRSEKQWWAEERSKVRTEVEAEAHQMRVYRAIYMLQRGKQPDGSPTRRSPFKIDKHSLMRLLQDDQQSLNELPRPYIYTVEGGSDVEVAAETLGYKDALEMIREIKDAPKMNDFIESETEVRMRQLYPDPLTDGTIAENAVRAVHSEGRFRVLGAELRRLRKLMAEDRPAVRAAERGKAREDREAREANRAQLPKRAELAMIKAGAREKVNTMAIRKIKPHVYLRAEQTAARAAFEAMEKRDYEAAYAAKLKQITNHEMYRAALAVRKDMDSTRNFIARFEGPRKQRQLAKSGVLDQVRAVLEGIELRKKSLAEVDRDKALKRLKQSVLDGRLIVTHETMRKIMDESVNWQEFTPEELHGMKDVLKQIEHGAVNEDKMTVNDELVDYKTIESEVEQGILENNKKIPLRPGGVQTSGERSNSNIDQGIMTWLRPSSIARVLDGSGFGAVTRRIIVPMRRAYAEKLIPMLHKAQTDVAGFYRKHYTASELSQMSKRLYEIESLGQSYSKSELLSMALNWGNQGNRDAVLGGTYEGSQVFSEQSVRQMLGHLTAKDWAFVQEIWDYNDTYREAIFDAEERRRGIRPQKVEPLPFTQRTADGQVIMVRGGYHPLKYDRSFDAESTKRVNPQRVTEDIEAQMQHLAVGGFVTASTKAGSTYARVKNHGRVVRLGLNIIDTHLREVIRDIAIGDEVLYIKRLMESGSFQRAMLDTNNGAALESLDLWLTDAAVGELPSENIWELGTAWIRTGFTKAKLGWNFTVMFLQFTGLFQTVAVIGTGAALRGLGKFAQNPAAAMSTVMEVSTFLKTRYVVGAFDKDVHDTKALVESEFGSMPTRGKRVYHFIGSTLFSGIAMAQKVVDVITWLGAYEKGLNDSSLMLSEADAIIYADTQVESAQTSGFFSDRSGLERGTTGLRKNRQSQFIRIWTTLISYMLAKGNIAYEHHKGTNYHDPKQVMALFYNLIMLWTVEGVASALLYNRLPEDDDDPEDWGLWLLEQSADSMYTGVPFVREVAAARFGGGNTPVGVFANDAFRSLEQMSQGEADWAAIDATLDVVGTAAHLPTGQMSKTGKKIWEDGITTDEWYEYFSGPRD